MSTRREGLCDAQALPVWSTPSKIRGGGGPLTLGKHVVTLWAGSQAVGQKTLTLTD